MGANLDLKKADGANVGDVLQVISAGVAAFAAFAASFGGRFLVAKSTQLDPTSLKYRWTLVASSDGTHFTLDNDGDVHIEEGAGKYVGFVANQFDTNTASGISFIVRDWAGTQIGTSFNLVGGNGTNQFSGKSFVPFEIEPASAANDFFNVDNTDFTFYGTGLNNFLFLMKVA